MKSSQGSRSNNASSITLNLGVGCAPSCWLIFGFRNLLGARRGAEGCFLFSPSSRFSGRGGGSQGRGGLGSISFPTRRSSDLIARGAGGEAVDVNGNLVEREKGD